MTYFIGPAEVIELAKSLVDWHLNRVCELCEEKPAVAVYVEDDPEVNHEMRMSVCSGCAEKLEKGRKNVSESN